MESENGPSVQIAPGKFKNLRDCTTAELEDAATLITDGRLERTIEREAARHQTADEGFDEEVIARRLEMQLGEDERRVLVHLELRKMVERRIDNTHTVAAELFPGEEFAALWSRLDSAERDRVLDEVDRRWPEHEGGA